jgi:hypothetical protein
MRADVHGYHECAHHVLRFRAALIAAAHTRERARERTRHRYAHIASLLRCGSQFAAMSDGRTSCEAEPFLVVIFAGPPGPGPTGRRAAPRQTAAEEASNDGRFAHKRLASKNGIGY